jgi:outer membrane protein OmpA-like peptidoglycan-associated protein
VNTDWVEGRFEGIYSGPRRPSVDRRSGRDRSQPRSDLAELSRFEFEIESGRLREVSLCYAPESEAVGDERVIRQHRVQHVRLADADGTESDHETSLFDVHIHDFQLKYPAVSGDRAYGTIVGRLRARRRPALSAPVPAAAVESTLASPAPHADAVEDDLGVPGTDSKRNFATNGERNGSTELLESPGWGLVMLLVVLVFAAIGTACGFRSGVAWLVPIELALGLRWLMRGRLTGGRPWWISAALPLMQLFVIWTPLEVAWQTGCWPVLAMGQLALAAVPMAFAAILGTRGSHWLTASIWTLMLCFSCAGLGAASCSMAHSNEATGQSDALVPKRPAQRTDEHGRWPVMPPAAGAISADAFPGDGAGEGGVNDLRGLGLGRPRAGSDSGTATKMPAPVPTPAPAPTRMSGTSTGHTSDSASVANAEQPTTSVAETALSASNGSLPPTSPPTSAPIATEKYRQNQVSGGWLSPEHRNTQRQQARISIEQANRTPALFFESGGAHRVYVPSDPIFEDGVSRPRGAAPLVLARIAALLSLPSKPRVMLEVHSDSAGIEGSQIELSRRRAEFIRSWLVDRGHVAPSRFDVMPIGGGHPLVPPDGDYRAQQPNRRIEIRLIEEE